MHVMIHGVDNLVKSQIRVMGVDDAPFRFGDKSTLVAAVVVRSPAYVESVLSTEVEVDGTDGTEKLADLICGSRHHEQLKAVMIDGAALGGFNVIDTEELYSKCRTPIITITRDKPDLGSMKQALQEHFKDWEMRWQKLEKTDLVEIETLHNPIYVRKIGLPIKTVAELIRLTTIRGVLPEPLRLAHLIATGVTTGESVSKA